MVAACGNCGKFGEMKPGKPFVCGVCGFYHDTDAVNERISAAKIATEKKEAAERARAREDAIADIARLGLSDYERALAYAIGVGLSGEDAAVAAKIGADSVSEETREETLTRIVGYGFSYDTAYRYAIACGYDEETAKKLALAADSVKKDQAGSAVYPFY